MVLLNILNGRSSDSGSPHTQNLSGAELNSGVRSLAALSSAPTLVDGATYEIDFNEWMQQGMLPLR